MKTKHFEIIWWVCVAMAALGIIVFWVAGFNDCMQLSEYAFFTAGIFAAVALLSKLIASVRRKNFCC